VELLTGRYDKRKMRWGMGVEDGVEDEMGDGVMG